MLFNYQALLDTGASKAGAIWSLHCKAEDASVPPEISIDKPKNTFVTKSVQNVAHIYLDAMAAISLSSR